MSVVIKNCFHIYLCNYINDALGCDFMPLWAIPEFDCNIYTFQRIRVKDIYNLDWSCLQL